LGAIASGEIEINGKSIENKNPRQAIANGFALLTEDRRANGIIPMLTVKDNTLAASYDKYTKIFLDILIPKNSIHC
jgi:methyl-galactoside transport system ATP-binding protein